MSKTLKNKHQFKKNKTHKMRGGGFDVFSFFKRNEDEKEEDLPFMYFYNIEITSKETHEISSEPKIIPVESKD
jgi:hypothetical protein